MIVIEKDAEVKLLDDLKTIRYESSGYRFIHYAFSQLPEKEKSVAQELLTAEIINDVLENPDAKIFICEDSDVIIVGPNIFTKTYDKLNQVIYQLLQFPKLHEILKLYDVDNSWPTLYKIVKDKCANIESKNIAEQAAQKQKAQDEMKETILRSDNLSQDLIKTIKERRARRSSINVMIVEDDGFSRKLVRNILNKTYEVIDVEDGKDALNSYVIISPDIIFLDIDLPDINGHEILQKLLKIDSEAYVVMLSGNSDQDNVIRAIKSGAKGFVTKPFLKDRL